MAIAAGVVVQTLETRFLGSPRRASFWVTFFAAGSAVLWLADRIGLMASPYSEPTLGLWHQDGTARQTPSVTSLEAFLKARDLDELLRVRRDISSLTSEEASRVASLVRDWTDRQAVANLLFYPDLIPATLRFEALNRALHSTDIPYLVLAATVGLQQIVLDEIPADRRAAWVQALLRFVQSKSNVLAGRASVTLYSWIHSPMAPDILPELLSLYPVPDEGACRNIVAAVLTECGDWSEDEFAQRLADWHVSNSARTTLRRAHEEYREAKAHDEFRALIMRSPVFAYIPNLSESALDNFGLANLTTD